MNDRATPGSKVTDLTSSPYNIRLSFGQSFSTDGAGAGWFGPLAPMKPVAPPEVAGRQLDFDSGYNLQLSPRPYEPIKFSDLRNLADGYDILRLIIETRKDQMERLAWKVQPKTGVDGKPMCKPDDPRIKTITKFFEKPDGKNYWGAWLRILLEDMFVIDAATLYKRRLRNGGLFSLEIIDGSTIKRVIDDWGRTPEAPAPAYQQILKGFPAVNYTTQDLLYLPRNVRAHKFYGYSPVEQVVMSVNIAMRRELFQLQYYTEGNMPEALIGTPDEWTPEQIQRFQNSFDSMLAGNQALRRRAKFIPGGVAKNVSMLKEPDLTGKQDEWLARVACFAFSISPQPFVSMMNRATADTAHDTALEEGLAPTQNWIKRFCDAIVEDDFKSDDIEFGWVDDREVDPKDQKEVLTGYVEDGLMTINEARDQIGQAPQKGGDVLRVKTQTGYVPVDINDDMPTAGEQADQDQKNTEQASKDKADALKSGVDPDAPSGGKKTDGGAAEKAAGHFHGRRAY